MRLDCRWPHQLNCAEVLVLTGHGRGRSSPQARRRSGPFSGSTGGKRRPDPHGHGSSRPSFSISSVSMPTTRSPRLTLDSLEGTPGGACWSAQKDAPASRSRYMTSSCLATSDRIIASTAVRCQLIFQATAPHWTSSSRARHSAVADGLVGNGLWYFAVYQARSLSAKWVEQVSHLVLQPSKPVLAGGFACHGDIVHPSASPVSPRAQAVQRPPHRAVGMRALQVPSGPTRSDPVRTRHAA